MSTKLKTVLAWVATAALFPAVLSGTWWLGVIRTQMITSDAVRAAYDLPPDTWVRMRHHSYLGPTRFPSRGGDSSNRQALWCGRAGSPTGDAAVAEVDVSWPLAVSGRVTHVALGGREVDARGRELLRRCGGAEN